MLKALVKKQFTEIFRGYFYDSKKNTVRAKGVTVVLFLGFAFLMVGILGGMFWNMAAALCEPLRDADMLWLYYVLTGLLSVFLGMFGSAFSTYQGLYLAKDNGLLLSMPIPVYTILLSRLVTVYLLGLLYSAVVAVPAVLVAWSRVPLRASVVVGGLLWIVLLSLLVLVLSCLLGWIVARISLKLKNKSIVTVLISLCLVGGYYFVYFKAQQWIQDLIANAAEYGARIKGAAYGLYLFGRAGEGDWLPLLGATALVAALCVAMYAVLSRTFLRIATSTGGAAKTRYKEKAAKQQNVSRALLRKEFGRFLASPNYMLNCGLSVILLPAAGVVLLWKGSTAFAMLESILGERPGALGAMLCAAMCFLASMNDMAAPSVSLEGKTVWILQSLPVTARQALQAKLRMQLWLSGVPMLFCAVCVAIVLPESGAASVLLVLFALSLVCCSAVYDLAVGLKWHNLNWTNELTPIKQSAAVMFALFGMWAYAILVGGLYLLVGYRVGLAVYFAAVTALNAVVSVLLYRWLLHRGTVIFADL